MQNNGNWKCFQLKDLGIYYGEVSYLKPSGEVVSEESLVGEEKNTVSKLRHGQGVQLFPTTSQSLLCKYEGHWQKDKRHGKGECTYPNGDTYKGDFVNDKRQGSGIYIWHDGKKYEGDWKNDMMDGNGCFTHPSSFELRGDFRANYYVHVDLILNPFIEGEDLKEEIRLQEEARKNSMKILEAQQKQVKIHRVPSPNELQRTIDSISKNNRVAVIISTSQSYLMKSDILRGLPNNTSEIDLRAIVSLRKAEGREKTRQVLRETCLNVFNSGSCLFLNMDDSTIKYDELYYPDLQEFFHPQSFPAALFKPEAMKKEEVWKTFSEDAQLNSDYSLVIWSKGKFDEALDDQDLLAKFEKKFGKVFSLDYVDLVLCNNQIEEENSYRDS